MVSRRQFLTIAGGGTALALASRNLGALGSAVARPGAEKVLVYLTPSCECCAKWVDHLEGAGFEVETKPVADVDPIKREQRHLQPRCRSTPAVTSRASRIRRPHP